MFVYCVLGKDGSPMAQRGINRKINRKHKPIALAVGFLNYMEVRNAKKF